MTVSYLAVRSIAYEVRMTSYVTFAAAPNKNSSTGWYDGQTDTFVELKTSMNIRNPADEARFEKYISLTHLL
jgi:hypothetical protein